MRVRVDNYYNNDKHHNYFDYYYFDYYYYDNFRANKSSDKPSNNNTRSLLGASGLL